MPLRTFALCGGLLLGSALLVARSNLILSHWAALQMTLEYHRIWRQRYQELLEQMEMPVYEPPSAPGHRNGPAPTSRPPSEPSRGGWRRLFPWVIPPIVDYYKSGRVRVADIAGIARGSPPPPRTTSEQGMNSGVNGSEASQATRGRIVPERMDSNKAIETVRRMLNLLDPLA